RGALLVARHRGDRRRRAQRHHAPPRCHRRDLVARDRRHPRGARAQRVHPARRPDRIHRRGARLGLGERPLLRRHRRRRHGPRAARTRHGPECPARDPGGRRDRVERPARPRHARRVLPPPGPEPDRVAHPRRLLGRAAGGEGQRVLRGRECRGAIPSRTTRVPDGVLRPAAPHAAARRLDRRPRGPRYAVVPAGPPGPRSLHALAAHAPRGPRHARRARAHRARHPARPAALACLPADARMRRAFRNGPLAWAWAATGVHAVLTLVSIGAFAVMIGRPVPGGVDAGEWARAYQWGMAYMGALVLVLGFRGAWLALWAAAGPIRATLGALLVTGFTLSIELVGAATGLPFGAHSYGTALGWRVAGLVPFTIPLSWFMMLFATL